MEKGAALDNLYQAIDKSEQFNNLIKQCYDDLCFYDHMEMTERKAFVEQSIEAIGESDLVIPYLPLYLTTKCSLNCEKCNNLIPYLKEAGVNLSWEKTKTALTCILDQVKELIFCELVGGEPFLTPEFEHILDFVSSQEKIRRIVVVTNATVIPSEDIIDKLAECKALVRVSDYGMFEQMAKFVSAMDKRGVNVRIQQDMKWNDPGGIQPRHKSQEELFRQYNRCEFSMKCKYLCEDKLFTCARAASLYYLGLLNETEDMLNIGRSITREQLREFYLSNHGEVCDYCDLWSDHAGAQIPAAVQLGGREIRHSAYTIISNYELEHFKNSTKKYEKMMKDKK